MVEHAGIEPATSSMPWMRATNCANAPRRPPQADSSQIHKQYSNAHDNIYQGIHIELLGW